MKYGNYILTILMLGFLLLSRYTNRVADMDLAESWKTHPILLGFTILLFITFIAFAIYRFQFNKTASRKESYKEEQKKYLKKNIEAGVFLYITKYGTMATILFPSIIIIYKYIGNPAIDFPYYLLWAGLIGYPFAYLMWIVEKNRYEKMK
jgi:uncharacterized membrane protein